MEKENYIQTVRSQHDIEGKKCYKNHQKGDRRQTLTGYVVDDLYFVDIEKTDLSDI
jgi:hypothetical protein